MPYGCYPPGLPVPKTAPFVPADRNSRSSLGTGPGRVANRERDFRGTQEVTFPLFTAAQALAFRQWFEGTLAHGGAWFITSNWPTPLGWRANVARRWVGEPRWEHVTRNRWRVSGTTEVMGVNRVRPEDVYCGGGGYACGESGPEFWMLSLDPPALNEWERPAFGGSFDITDDANWRPWVQFTGAVVGNLFGFQQLLVRRYNVIRSGGALVSATPDTTTTAETIPAAERQWVPSGSNENPTLLYVDGGEDNDGSVWRVEPSNFDASSGVLRLGGGSQLLVTVTGGGSYADLALEYACVS